MNFPQSLYSRKPKAKKLRLRPNSQDLFLYQAITGRSPEIEPKDGATEPPPAEAAESIESPRWTPSVAELTLKLRTLWEQGLAQSVRKPEIADWLRNVSDEAFRRFDQAHMRLRPESHDPSRRRIAAREVMSVQPADEIEPERFYKRVA